MNLLGWMIILNGVWISLFVAQVMIRKEEKAIRKEQQKLEQPRHQWQQNYRWRVE